MAPQEWDPLLPNASRQTGRNYTGILTKTIVYGITLVLFLIAYAFTISSILLPSWVSYNSEKPPLHYSYGLHRRCSSLTDICEPFPQYEDCHGENRYFCSMWRSVGFLMTFAVVLMSLAIVAYIIILSGGKRLRETGWGVLSTIIILSVAVQVASMALIAYLFDNDERFFVGWQLDKSFAFCTVSWCISLFCAAAVVVAARTLPPEGGYELIPGYGNDTEEVQ
ncbi:conserved hypothetical protein [Talaromyces stipitatus ATCC 10500]|uniref:Uncharacterized protein n=1 Tax=Talaromyces stipitatus (strain ATCC 10500 / CBS 375.48 / QM 6759 / NRRL 1006) TaxID=441959 RepID=B8M7G4_TALSN|nr:uncharacterized protein TSTA_036100 [Talaromyces stipitatus ATCC 10500]EED20384.1 conserved hypothetical protein [Talaromyces stipitatus ATCC 10500]